MPLQRFWRNMKQYFELCNNGIEWNVTPGQNHRDSLEMSGSKTDCFIGYGTEEDGTLFLSRHYVFPTLRTIPNNTHGSFQLSLSSEQLPQLRIDNAVCAEHPVQFRIDGILSAVTEVLGKVRICRKFFPADHALGACEQITVTNTSEQTISLTFTLPERSAAAYGRGTKGVYVVEVSHTGTNIQLPIGKTYSYEITITARIAHQQTPVLYAATELRARRKRIRELCGRAVLKTGNPEIDTMFRLAKLRAGESLFDTLTGLRHNPGGKTFYAATWCNDQVEYAGPWFACTGDKKANLASINAYLDYIPFMSDLFTKIPSSVIAEGLDIWEGAGDRGDAAMYLYGASLFTLLRADSKVTETLWPAIQWCAEYCHRKMLPDGVIGSDSDELEGRFPTDGVANLSTSCLCYGGLGLAAILADELNESSLAQIYRTRQKNLGLAIECYFGETLHGFHTYRYTKGHDTLRSWICLPLCVGLTQRAEGTLQALFSDYLWTEEGMLTCERGEENKSNTIWDRSTLFGFKGAFLNGYIEPVWPFFESYCKKRLLCERVPYAIEAYPEGGMRQLSGESALFCRIITEGLLGIRPEGFSSFSFIPQLPKALPQLYLTDLVLFGKSIDILVEKNNYEVRVDGKTAAKGPLGQRVPIHV